MCKKDEINISVAALHGVIDEVFQDSCRKKLTSDPAKIHKCSQVSTENKMARHTPDP